ncbi:unnamed protein product [Parajaminaea phylloscopi]
MPSSPAAARSEMRLYESYISPSPKMHMMFTAPLSKLKQRTSGLVDQITGATLPPDVMAEEKRIKNEKRKWRCGACRLTFAGNQELLRHFNLFPNHVEIIEARRQGRPPAVHSTSDLSGTLSAQKAPPKPIHQSANTEPRRQRPRQARQRMNTTPADWTVLSDRSVDDTDSSAVSMPASRVSSDRHRGARNLNTRTSSAAELRISSRNEEQGRASVRRVEDERQLERIARAAHEAKADAARQQARQNVDRVVSSLRSRTLSESVIPALKRASSSISLRGLASEQADSKSPQVKWDPRAKSAFNQEDVFFDAETGQESSDVEGQSSVHGETRPVTLASPLMDTTPGSSGVGIGSLDDDRAPYNGRRPEASRRSSRIASAHGSRSHRYSTDANDVRASPTAAPRVARRKPPPQPDLAAPQEKNLEWVPSSRPAPTHGVAQRESRVSLSSAGPFLPPVETSESLSASLFAALSIVETETRDTAAPVPAADTITPSSLRSDAHQQSNQPASPPASPTQQVGAMERPSRPRRNTNPFRTDTATSELPYLQSDSATTYLSSPTRMSPATPPGPEPSQGNTSRVAYGRDVAGSNGHRRSPSAAWPEQQLDSGHAQHRRSATTPTALSFSPPAYHSSAPSPQAKMMNPQWTVGAPTPSLNPFSNSAPVSPRGATWGSQTSQQYAPPSGVRPEWVSFAPPVPEPGSNNPYHYPQRESRANLLPAYRGSVHMSPQGAPPAQPAHSIQYPTYSPQQHHQHPPLGPSPSGVRGETVQGRTSSDFFSRPPDQRRVVDPRAMPPPHQRPQLPAFPTSSGMMAHAGHRQQYQQSHAHGPRRQMSSTLA